MKNRKMIVKIDGVLCEFYLIKTSLKEIEYLKSKADSFEVIAYVWLRLNYL